MAAEGVSAFSQFAPQRLKIVNLSVENHHVSAISRFHRLMSLIAQVHNSQAAMPQRQAHFRVRPYPFIIGTAMAQGVGHSEGYPLQLHFPRPSARLTKSSNATHTNS